MLPCLCPACHPPGSHTRDPTDQRLHPPELVVTTCPRSHIHDGGNHRTSQTDLPWDFGLDCDGHLWGADEGPLDLNVFPLLLHVELQLFKKKNEKKTIGGLLSPPEPQCMSVCSFLFLDSGLSPALASCVLSKSQGGSPVPDCPSPVV